MCPKSRHTSRGEERENPSRIAPLSKATRNTPQATEERQHNSSCSSPVDPQAPRKRGRPRKRLAPHEDSPASDASTEENTPIPLSETDGSSDDSDETSCSRNSSSEPSETRETRTTQALTILRSSEIKAAQQKDEETRAITSWLADRKGSEPIQLFF